MLDERGVKLDISVEEEPTKESEVFYNTDMVLNRDVSVSALQAYADNQSVDLKILDALSATGVRGIRYAKQVEGLEKVVLNDSKPEAVENIKNNLERNEVDRDLYTVEEKDANLLMTENRKGFHFIDLDPFGSPTRFLDSAARSLKHDSYLGVSATDLATLCGTYVKTCRRRYGTWNRNLPYCHEVGLRVLVRAVFEALAKYNKVFRPEISFAKKHYYRVQGKVKETKKGVNRSLKNVGFLVFCEECGYRRFIEEKERRPNCPSCSEETCRIGPLWTGRLGNKEKIEETRIVAEDKGYEDAEKLLGTLRDECEIRRPYYDTHNFGKITGLPVPRLDELLEKIRDKGYTAVKTHFAPTGIKTNCPAEDIREMVVDLNEN